MANFDMYEAKSKISRRLEGSNYCFARNKQKSEVHNGPLLAIGLGGSGFDALSRTKEKLFNCFEHDEEGNLNGVAFLEIDTDDTDKARCLASPRAESLRADEFKVFQNADIGAILRARKSNKDVLPKEIEEWLDPSIPVAQIVHGAAGIRQAGRLLLHLNAVEIIDTIQEKLDKIRPSVFLTRSPINVVIFAGLGGGTGSGTFVDVAYIVRQCIEQFSGQAFITGIMLMPDILAGDPNVDKLTRENIKRNGFAALKELDHLMNLSETKDSFEQKYPGGFSVPETDEAIFDRCVLISSMAEGRFLLPNAKEHAYNIASEMVVDMLNTSSIISKGSNDISRRDIALTNNKNRKPVNYVYTAVGGKATYIDFDLIFNLFIKNSIEYDTEGSISSDKLENEVNKIWNDKKFEKIISDFSKRCNEAVVTSTEGVCFLVRELSNGEKKSVKSNEEIREHLNAEYKVVDSEENLEKYQQAIANKYGSSRQILLGELNTIWLEINDKPNAILRRVYEEIQNEIDKVKLLIDGEDSKSDDLKQTYREDIHNYCDKYKEWKDARKKKKNKPKGIIPGINGKRREPSLAEVSINLSKINRQKEAETNVFVFESMKNGLKADLDGLFAIKAYDDGSLEYRAWVDIWKDILNSKYGSGADWRGIETIWERNDSLFGNGSIIPNFREISVEKFVKIMNYILMTEKGGEIKKAAEEYKEKLSEDCSRDKYITPEFITGKLFDQAFANTGINLDDLVEKLLDKKTYELGGIWEDVINRIVNQSGVLFSRKAMWDGEVFEHPSYSEIMIPEGNKILEKACKKITGQDAEVSKIGNRISCMRYTQCQKIDDYVYIDELEQAYNLSNSKCGLHLYKSDKKDWEELPSPVYRNKEADIKIAGFYEDANNAKFYREVFDKAVENGIIIDDPKNKRYKMKDILGSSDSKNPDYLDICTLQYNETNKENIYKYCQSWFVKMFKYRQLVAEKLGMKKPELVQG